MYAFIAQLMLKFGTKNAVALTRRSVNPNFLLEGTSEVCKNGDTHQKVGLHHAFLRAVFEDI